MPGVDVARVGLGSSLLPSQGPTDLFALYTIEGITVWLPWCTMDSACGLMTLSMTASPSITQQVTLGLPLAASTLSCQHPVPSEAPLS